MTEQSDASKAVARVGHRWAPGESGNPRGPRKELGPVRDLARRYTLPAIRRLAQLSRSKNERVAAFACVALLDRGWGKPAQALTGPDGGPLGVVVGKLPTSPIDDVAAAAAAYLAFIGNPDADLSGVTFAPSMSPPQSVEESPQPSVEAAREPIKAEPPPDYQPALAADLECEFAPDDEKVVRLWSRLGR
jgi:hypothetical protein